MKANYIKIQTIWTSPNLQTKDRFHDFLSSTTAFIKIKSPGSRYTFYLLLICLFLIRKFLGVFLGVSFQFSSAAFLQAETSLVSENDLALTMLGKSLQLKLPKTVFGYCLEGRNAREELFADRGKNNLAR